MSAPWCISGVNMPELQELIGLKNFETIKSKVLTMPAAAKKGRFHLSPDPIAKMGTTYRRLLGVADYKPRGLWYDLNGSWVDMLMEDAKYAMWALNRLDESNYVYKVTVDKSKILVINSVKKAVAFTNKYGVVLPSHGYKYNFLINWKKVAREYDGIEVRDCCEDLDGTFLWFSYWDCSSGCVWNKSGVKKLKLVASY